MRTLIRSLAALAAVPVLVVPAVRGTAGAATTTSTAPATIPALRSWTPADGSFTLRSDAHVVVPVEDASALAYDAALLVQDLASTTGVSTLVRTEGVPRAGDLVLSLDPDASLGAEGYKLNVAGALTVSAPTTAGVFNGGRSVLQILRQGRTVPAGTAADWPRYPDRGLMVDAGRRHFPLAFYEEQIKQMSYLKLNLLHLHLSDDAGLAIESERHPESVAPEHLTKAEVRQIVALAAKHHIRVMPEIDMPGHMTGILRSHPELQLKNGLGIAEPSRLDVTNPAARAFAKDLISEYLPLFPATEWHIGADEYMKLVEYPLYPALQFYAWSKFGLFSAAKDTVHDFVNEMAGFLRSHGRAPRMWNDDAGGGLAVRLDPSIVVEWWTDINPLSDPFPPTPKQLVNDGHQVLNNGWWPTYFASPGLPAPSFREAYEKWRVHDFYGIVYLNSTLQAPPKSLSPTEPKNRGSKLAIWSDGPVMTDRQLLDGSLVGLRMIAQKTWESPLPGTYDRFLAIAAAIGNAPGV